MGMLGGKLVPRMLMALVLVLGLGIGGTYIYRAATGAEDQTTANDRESAEGAAEGGENTEVAEGQGSADDEQADDDGETAVPVNVADVQVGSVSTYITATANLVPEDQVKVLAESEGRVTRLLVEEGDHVWQGQLLAALLRDEAEILVNKARLTADNAALAYERSKKVFAEKLISQEEFDKITMEHRIALQELAEAEWKLERTEVRAPFDGRVTMRDCTLGQHVRPGDELFTVTDFDPLVARIYLPEKEIVSLDAGREVRITLKADDEIAFAGKIRQISPVVDTATGTVKVTVAAIRPPESVRPGGFVTIDITRETRTDTMLLPREAVVRELKKAHVFVAAEEVAQKRAVTLGLEEGDRIEILTGIELGERIVVAGQGGLEDGSPIKILPLDDPEAAQAALEQEGSESQVQG